MPALPPRLLAAAVAGALPGALGCGAPEPVAVGDSPLRLVLDEYRIAPQAVRVPAGRVVLTVRNEGTMVHRLQVRTRDRSRRLGSSPPLRPGESARLVLELPPGTYAMSCPLDRHRTLGQHGTIEAR